MRLRLGPLQPERLIRKMLPRGLFGRSLLIVLVPMVVLQGVALQIFYGSHLDELSRRLAGAVAGEIGFMIDQIDRDPTRRTLVLQEADKHFTFRTVYLKNETLRHLPPPDAPGPVDTDLARALAQDVHRPFNVAWHTHPGILRVNIQMADGVMSVDVPRKRLFIGTLYIFLVWLIGSAVLLAALAALFLRTQVRGIRRLAEAAENFGMGRDHGPIRPEGAIEVRRAATAFNRMRERLRRFVSQRTTMLAGVSHDLRTPLTRLRLALAMQPSITPEDLQDMESDIADMERLIGIYLSFARGEGAEQALPTDLPDLLDDICATARRTGATINLSVADELTVTLRPEATRRAFTNLIDNARRHATQIWVSATRIGGSVQILIDDNGPGIPEQKRETLLKPFESDHPGGTGLGLSIARDIIIAHGGSILLLDRPGGGLRVVVELPG
ncbi:ATP-binding protein [Acidocella aminolytica]|uniref:histidine kinase n=1 Tax=Acidocella aminolytica 101 = DSM 11237 TaxID=1120923 RepID=A0A0D6PID8_9PROT|nr:ATP-binding protein [Acidocella aminolytica]GAN80973.1 two component sensor histidine kinase EnvZ [Acidocella aminolytica 101 = DSM 11237]GBQ37132.1 two component sensor histidine kinase EnvZ [Acidocella aminolytica 101 = DSM 11237]SHF31050.1 two-component system, OmpR family, osmolarity sensor histidine kinase EnvZ [Acidocella aminolytica 101 = DSM 11237]